MRLLGRYLVAIGMTLIAASVSVLVADPHLARLAVFIGGVVVGEVLQFRRHAPLVTLHRGDDYE